MPRDGQVSFGEGLDIKAERSTLPQSFEYERNQHDS